MTKHPTATKHLSTILQPANVASVALLRLPQIIGCKKRGIAPIIPVSKSSWWQGIKDGRYPAPVRIGKKAVAWPASSVLALVQSLTEREAA